MNDTLTLKEINGKHKVNICCADRVLWEGLTKSGSIYNYNEYYDFDTYHVASKINYFYFISLN